MWELIDGTTDTRASETPGAGCIVATPGIGMVFVPNTRLVLLREQLACGATHVMVREDRTAPPLTKPVPISDPEY